MTKRSTESIVENTENKSPQWVIVEATTGETNLTRLQELSSFAFQTTSILAALNKWSDDTGGHVRLIDELSYFPHLVGDNGELIPLFEFVEVMDELVDYDEIKGEFPNLSYEQIYAAISFLRKIAQINLRGVDIDELEDEFVREEFLTELREALQDQEPNRVLNFSE